MRPLHPVSPGIRDRARHFLLRAVRRLLGAGSRLAATSTASSSPIRCRCCRDGWRLLVEDRFWLDILITIWRVFGGFVLAAVVAVPIGIAMGAWKPVEAFLEPFVSFARYLPASAFIPLLILWAGIGETGKAAGHLRRLGVPDHPDRRGQGRLHAARPGRGRLHAGRQRQRHRHTRDHAGQCAGDRRDRCAWCSAGPGPMSSSPN